MTDKVDDFLAHALGQDAEEEFLSHHGVMGMKWGHHKGASGNAGGGSGHGGSAGKTNWELGKSSKPSKGDIVTARHNQIARRQAYQQAVKSGASAKTIQAKKDAFNFNQDRVTADHLTRGEKAVSLLLNGGGTISAARTNRSVTLSNKRAGARIVGSNLAGAATIAGVRAERGSIQRQINQHNSK
jgi:hypothetical protein